MDLSSMRLAILERIPIQSHWLVNGTSVDYDFSEASRALAPIPNFVVQENPEWRELLVFGTCDYANGGGAKPWLCIRKSDGVVVGFDGERENPVFTLNTTIERFVQTFEFLNTHLSEGKKLPESTEAILKLIDPDSYSASDWCLLVEYLRAGQ
jgi:hypothetical protein